MLAGEITNLASLWRRGVTCWLLTADVWVQVGEGRAAVAAGGDWQDVDVVWEWAALLWDVAELDVEVHAVTVAALRGDDGALDAEWVLWENGCVGWSGWLVGNGGGIAELL